MLPFSVIIPVYNRTEQLARCLSSLSEQSYRDFEVIVIDDGSTDSISTIVTACGLPVQLLRQPINRGPGAARNAGIEAARGKYIAFLDSDDTWFRWTLAIYDMAMTQYGDPSFIAGQKTEETERSGTELRPSKMRYHSDYLSTAREGILITTSAAVLKTDVLRSVGGFSEQRMNAEDSDLWLRAGTAPGFVQIVDPPACRYYRASNSLVHHRDLGQLGIETLIAREKTDCYPGGALRIRERRRIIGQHVRPYVVASLRRKELALSFRVYSASFWWLLRDCRFKFLVGFWLLFTLKALTGRPKPTRV